MDIAVVKMQPTCVLSFYRLNNVLKKKKRNVFKKSCLERVWETGCNDNRSRRG